MNLVENVVFEGRLFAIIVPSGFRQDGTQFLTPDDLPQQLSYIQHPRGHKVRPHTHAPKKREIHLFTEVLFVRRGKLRVDFLDESGKELGSRILQAGACILLVEGGHGFEMLENVEMLMIKQGPFGGDEEKKRF